MVYTIGPISGCHVNPAVSFGLLLSGKFEARHLPGYVIAQTSAVSVAAAAILVIAKGIPGGYDPAVGGLAPPTVRRPFSWRL